jgi:uncharacterized protein
VLKSAIQNARLGREEELGALQRLDAQARQLERHASGPSVPALIADERERSHSYDGRTVFGSAQPLVSRFRSSDDFGLVVCYRKSCEAKALD